MGPAAPPALAALLEDAREAPVLYHAGISGGKDSTALALWLVHESGLPREAIRLTFCDTGNELDTVYAYVRLLSERVHPVTWLRPRRAFYALARHKGRFPSPKARFCTTELKMIPTRDHVHWLAGHGYRIVMASGVRAEESAERARLPVYDPDPLRGFFGYPEFRPLLAWTLDDVWAIHARYGIPRNPLYAAGMRRVGCAPCIMSRKDEILRLARLFPERIELLRAAERSVGEHARCGYSSFFARDKVPLSQRSIPIETKAGESITVASIDDVVRWAATSRGGQQYRLDIDWEEEAAPTCAHRYGACE